MRSLIGLLVFALAAQLWTSPAVAQEGVLNGTVVGADGRPRPYALVQLEGTSRHSAMADAMGRFTITRLAPGNYEVRIRQGDNVETQQRTINPGTVTLKVRW